MPLHQHNSFGRYVKSLRTSKKMTRALLAEMLGMKHSQSIANIENGRATLPPKYARKFIQVMRISQDEFVTEFLKDNNQQIIHKMGLKLKVA